MKLTYVAPIKLEEFHRLEENPVLKFLFFLILSEMVSYLAKKGTQT